MPLSAKARRNAGDFVRLLRWTFGPAVRLPVASATVDGGYALLWTGESTANERFVEVVFFLNRIEYAVIDSSDVTDAYGLIINGETSDPTLVMREVVKPYVAAA